MRKISPTKSKRQKVCYICNKEFYTEREKEIINYEKKMIPLTYKENKSYENQKAKGLLYMQQRILYR